MKKKIAMLASVIMLIAAAPGMIYTAATAWLFGKIFMRCRLGRR